MSNKLRTLVVVIITVVWALSFVASLVFPSVEVSPELNSIFMATVGATLLARKEESEAKEHSEEKETGDRQP